MSSLNIYFNRKNTTRNLWSETNHISEIKSLFVFFCLLLTQLCFQREKAEKLTEFGHRLCVPKLEPVFGSLISVPGGALARRQQLHCPLDVLQLLHWDGILQQQRHTGTEHEEAAAGSQTRGRYMHARLRDYSIRWKNAGSSSKRGPGSSKLTY